MQLTTFERFDERDQALLDEVKKGFPVDVMCRQAPEGDEDVILVEHQTLDVDDFVRMAKLHTLLLFEHGRALLPINHLEAKGVLIRRIPNLSGLGVAEHTFALLLALKKHVVSGHQAVIQNVWRDDVTAPLLTDQRAHVFNWSGISGLGWLYGETIGIVGFGRIGKAVAERAQAFGMNVLYYNRHRLSPLKEHQLGVRYAELHDLLTESDVVTLHLPFSPDSERLLGAAELARMKPTALLINVARGRIVDEEALTAALQNGVLAGAGLDVLVYEPPHPTNPILNLDNVVLSPHTAGVYSPTARREQFRTALSWALATSS